MNKNLRPFSILSRFDTKLSAVELCLRLTVYMERRWWMVFLILMCLFVGSIGRGLEVNHKVHSTLYNHTLATILVEYASAVSSLYFVKHYKNEFVHEIN
ncbi:hypothetical protein R6Q57_012612 [Mikania cordata]